jgi:hypothetical protein
VLCRLIDIGAPKQIVQPADAEPPIAISLDHQPMPAVLVRAAVILCQKIDQKVAVFGVLALQPDGKCDLVRFGIEVVNK